MDAASSASYNSLYPGRLATSPGRLYLWGKCGGKGGRSLPVKASAVDRAGDCIYPAPCNAPKDARAPIFLKASVDVGPFAALDCHGRCWAWSGWGSERWPAVPTVVLADCVDCAAGAGFVVAVKADGSVWLQGKAPSPTRLPSAISGSWVEIGWASPAAGTAVAVEACGGVVLVATSERELFSCGSGIALGLKTKGGVATLAPLSDLPPVCAFSVGSLHAACAGVDGSMWCWGDGLSGNLGTGTRKSYPSPVRVELAIGRGERVVHVSCTRGQPRPKRLGKASSCAHGQEGPRCHAVAADGGLWIAGAAHKGMGADHLSKTLGTTGSDHLSFYRVGGRAQAAKTEGVMSGAAEDLKTEPELAARRMGVKHAASFGRDGDTHYLEAVRIVSSCPSHIHSLALAEDGRAFAWGCGSDGRTGLAALMRGPRGAKRTLKCYVSTPSVVEALEGKRVLQLSSGRYWSVAVVASEPGRTKGGGASTSPSASASPSPSPSRQLGRTRSANSIFRSDSFKQRGSVPRAAAVLPEPEPEPAPRKTSLKKNTAVVAPAGGPAPEDAKGVDAEQQRQLWALDPAAQLTDYMFLGSALASENSWGLAQSGITRVLNVADDIGCYHPDQFEYLHLKIEDGGEDSGIVEHMERAIAFVEEAKRTGAKVLVHCYMGVNRSATVAMAVLVALEGMSLRQAFAHVQERREIKLRPGNQQKVAHWEERRTGACTLPAWKD